METKHQKYIGHVHILNNMAEEKVYRPEVIEEIPLPMQTEDVFSVSQGKGTQDTYSPKTIKDQPIPRKVIAQETIASSFNTKSRKILAEYQFTESGALAIGKYEHGVSGDIRISPSGIIARDKAGVTTFAIDGETGDATFKGTVEAGDFTVIDDQGLISLASFETGTVALASNATSSSPGWVDVSGLSLEVNLRREATVIILASLSGRNTASHTTGGQQLIRFDINGSPTGAWDLSGLVTGFLSTTVHYVAVLPAGNNTIKVQHNRAVAGDAIIAGSTGTENAGSRLSYIVLGR